MKRALAFLPLLLLAPAAVRSAPEIVDRIVAVVGDEIILLSEVDEEVYLAQLGGQLDLSDQDAVREFRRKVLESKIEEKVLLEKARAEGIRVTRGEVNEAVDRMVGDIRGRFPDEASFEAQLAREGMTLEDLRAAYRSRIEEQLMVRELMDRLVRSRVSVDEREIRRYWDENRESIGTVPAALELRQIVVGRRSEAGVDSAAVERARIVLQRLRAGEDFATLARVFSEGPAASRGGELGWFRDGDLEPRLAAAVAGLEAGGISEVVVTDRGAHILKVDERRDGEAHLRQIVFLRDEEAAAAATRARAEAILRRLQAGESFETVAREESDDLATRDSGGAVGRIPVEALGPELRAKLEPLAPGEMSGLLENEDGFSIFLVEGKEGERPATFEDVHDRIRALLEQKRAKEIYGEIIEQAREDTYIENRMTTES